MSGVLTDAVGRQDVLIRRGARTQWAIRWEQSTNGGYNFEPVDLADYSATGRLLSPTGDTWLELSCEVHADGLVVITVDPADLTDLAWASRAGGIWQCDLTDPDGVLMRHGEGYFYVED